MITPVIQKYFGRNQGLEGKSPCTAIQCNKPSCGGRFENAAPEPAEPTVMLPLKLVLAVTPATEAIGVDPTDQICAACKPLGGDAVKNAGPVGEVTLTPL